MEEQKLPLVRVAGTVGGRWLSTKETLNVSVFIYVKMCNECVKEEYPDRDNVCLEDGAYFLNFAGCSQCHGRDVLLVENRLRLEDDEEETVTYDHVCKECLHLVASHTYKFRVEDEFQEYEMSCMLCGTSEDTRSIMPYDPRQQPLFI